MPALEQGVVLTEREVWEDCAGVRQGPSNHRAKHAPLRTTHDLSNSQIASSRCTPRVNRLCIKWPSRLNGHDAIC